MKHIENECTKVILYTVMLSWPDFDIMSFGCSYSMNMHVLVHSWPRLFFFTLTIEKGGQITSQLELQRINLGCSKGECIEHSCMIRIQCCKFIIVVSCINLTFILGRFRYQLFWLPVTFIYLFYSQSILW